MDVKQTAMEEIRRAFKKKSDEVKGEPGSENTKEGVNGQVQYLLLLCFI